MHTMDPSANADPPHTPSPAASGRPRASTWALVGTGAVAGALATRLASLGHPVLLHGRDVAATRRLAACAGERVAAVKEPRDLAGARAIVLAVSDNALADVAQDVARVVPAETTAGTQRVVLHTSGAHGVEVLYALSKAGFAVGGVHPLAALAPGSDGAVLERAWFALEGEAAALAVARALVDALRGDCAEEPRARELVLGSAPGAKLRYHAAASLVSGGVVALLALAEEALAASGIEPTSARAALAALADGAVANVAARGPAAALTGPAARGDVKLVRGQLGALGPEASAVYRALLRRLAALASARGSLDASAAAALCALAQPESPRGRR
jgi:predicted short-subunit dehydrogenase-like oxidoreductase (DUF2520 family)